jgi:hypothetical protein
MPVKKTSIAIVIPTRLGLSPATYRPQGFFHHEDPALDHDRRKIADLSPR